MRLLVAAFCVLSCMFSVACGADGWVGKSSVFPKNDMNISVEQQQFLGGGLSEQEFNDVMQSTKEVLTPFAKANNEGLVIDARWSDGTVNGAMNRMNGKMYVYAYGGLARHQLIQVESFALVMGHEASHGYCWSVNGNPVFIDAPRKICSEANADYNGNGDFNLLILKNLMAKGYRFSTDTTPKIADACSAQFEGDEFELCVARLNAGIDLAGLLAELNRETSPVYERRDSTVVTRTNVSYPPTQCRLDQYWDGVFHLPYSKCWFKVGNNHLSR